MTWWEKRYQERGFEWGEDPSLVGRISAVFLKDRQSARVLDLGCGYGRDCMYLAQRGFEVVGVDISPTALRIGEKWKKRVGANVQFICAGLEDIVFNSASFDAVITYNVMQVFNEAQRSKIIAEISRILKPGGLLVQAVFSTKEEGYGRGDALEKDSYPTPGGRLRHFFSRGEIEEVFAEFKFLQLEEVVIPEQQVGKSFHFHQEWLMVLEKNYTR